MSHLVVGAGHAIRSGWPLGTGSPLASGPGMQQQHKVILSEFLASPSPVIPRASAWGTRLWGSTVHFSPLHPLHLNCLRKQPINFRAVLDDNTPRVGPDPGLVE